MPILTRLPNISEARQEMRSGRLTSVELLASCLDRIARYENDVHAWVIVDQENALRRARELDAMQARGEFQGLLHGIPVGIKDIVDVEGLPTRAGSRLFGEQPAARDAPVVAALRRAGAVIVGKTVTTELACFDPPPTRNPWNLSHTPGGSSSGSAAAVAAGMCLAAVGSQTGGSIIRPAAFCGIAGFKPTIGVCSTQGVVPVSRTLDHPGPLAGNTADLTEIYRVLAGVSGAKDSADAVRFVRLFGFLEELADAEVRASFESTIQTLTAAGLRIDTTELPESLRPIHTHHRCVMVREFAEAYGSRFRRDPGLFGRCVSGLIEEGLTVSDGDYQQALALRDSMYADFAVCLGDAVGLLPSTRSAAPADLSTTGDPAMNSPWSFLGVPTATIPDRLTANGLPTGLQLIGVRGTDTHVLQAALLCEPLLQFDRIPRTAVYLRQ